MVMRKNPMHDVLNPPGQIREYTQEELTVAGCKDPSLKELRTKFGGWDVPEVSGKVKQDQTLGDYIKRRMPPEEQAQEGPKKAAGAFLKLGGGRDIDSFTYRLRKLFRGLEEEHPRDVAVAKMFEEELKYLKEESPPKDTFVFSTGEDLDEWKESLVDCVGLLSRYSFVDDEDKRRVFINAFKKQLDKLVRNV